MSLQSGKDTTGCGAKVFPCRTISYAVHLVSAGSVVFIDGRGTSWQRSYTCQPHEKEHRGIYVRKNTSFISTISRAHIACSHGNVWIVDGSGVKEGIHVNFKGLAFKNSSFHFRGASANIKDCTFQETKHPVLDFSTVKLDSFGLTIENVLFQQNMVCIMVESNKTRKGDISVDIRNSVFKKNGDIFSFCSSILWLNSNNDDMNVEIRNVSFNKNWLCKNGMIFVNNEHGTTNTFLFEVRLVDSHSKLGHPGSMFWLTSGNMNVTIAYTRVFRSTCRFLQAATQAIRINVSNTEVEDFIIISSEDGGLFNIEASQRCNMSVIHSVFRNGIAKNTHGGVVSVVAPTSTIFILNSTTLNVSNENYIGYGYGGALYVKSYVNVSLNILNSSFFDNLSNSGGAISVFGRISVTVMNSMFIANRALESGGSIYLFLYSKSTIKLQNSSFNRNSAYTDGGAIYIRTHFGIPTSNFVATRVDFIRNTAAAGAVATLRLYSTNFTISFQEARVVRNVAKYADVLVLDHIPINGAIVHLVVSNCVFTGNRARYGTIGFKGRYNIICQNSAFHSNSADYRCGALSLDLKDSILKVVNSTFVNNSCDTTGGGAIGFHVINNTKTIITDSRFFNNTAFDGTGGAISVLASTDQINTTNCRDPFNARSFVYLNSLEFYKVHFQGNIAKNGNALYIFNSFVTLKSCLVIDNLGYASGSQLVTYGTTKLKIYNSVFKETTAKVSLYGTEYVFSSFLGIYSDGSLVVNNSTFDQTTQSNKPLIVVSKMGLPEFDNSSLMTCPQGFSLTNFDNSYMRDELYGCTTSVTSIRLFCQQCNSKFYSIQFGQSKGLNINKGFVCSPCPYGANCLSSVKSKDDFWGYKSGFHPPTLTFIRCPVDYCKSPKPGSDSYNACQGKRSGVMCGTCSRGYTETLLSTRCTLAKDCKQYWFWIALLFFICLTAFLLIFKPPVITFLVKQVLWIKNLSGRQALFSGEVRHENKQYSYFVEITFYFYQMSQLFLSSLSSEEYSKTIILPFLLALFNFQFSISEKSCPFVGLMPHTKKLFKIVPVLATMTVIYIIYGFHYIFSRVRGTHSPSLAPYLAASVRTLFLSYTVLATVSIQLIRCININAETRWFYNGNVVCYQWWQYAAVLFNSIFVLPFMLILAWASYKLHKQAITLKQLLIGFILPLPSLVFLLFSMKFSPGINHVEQTANLEVLQKMLLTPFREPRALHWKSIMIARRLVLVLLFCFINETSYKLFWMTTTCLLALFHHLSVKPFKHKWVNNLESVSLLFLVVLGFINLYKTVLVESSVRQTDSVKAIQWLEVVILAIFPASIFLLFSVAIISLFVRFCHWFYGSLCRRLFKMESRDRTQLLDICENFYYE